jgi:hypothetical protein
LKRRRRVSSTTGVQAECASSLPPAGVIVVEINRLIHKNAGVFSARL